MHANRLTRIVPLLVVAVALAGCNLGGGGGTPPPDGITPSPTLIEPVPITTEPPPEVSPTFTPTPTVEPVTETPTPTPTATPEQPSSHQVAKGEWVYAIARIYGINPRDLIAANPGIQSNPDLIYPNQQLVIPGAAQPVASQPSATPVAGPTAGAPSIPVADRAVYEALLAEDLPPLAGDSCSTPTSSALQSTWGLANVAPRLGCATGDSMIITGTWMEFGPGARIIWLREPHEFHAIAGDGMGPRWVFADNSGMTDAPLVVGPGSNQGYTLTEGRFGWLLNTNPEMRRVFAPAFGDESVLAGEYQRFEHGAILYDGALKFVFFDDQGPWWYLPQPQSQQTEGETQPTQ